MSECVLQSAAHLPFFIVRNIEAVPLPSHVKWLLVTILNLFPDVSEYEWLFDW